MTASLSWLSYSGNAYAYMYICIYAYICKDGKNEEISQKSGTPNVNETFEKFKDQTAKILKKHI